MMKPTLMILSLIALLSSCASTPSYKESAQSLGDDLFAQVESRVDVRGLRLFIDEFHPCRRSTNGAVMPMGASMAASHEATSERVRHGLMQALAPRLNVIASDSFLATSQYTDVFELAAEVGATAVLTGNYVMEGEEIVVMLRVVELPSRLLLAATEGTVAHGKRSSHHVSSSYPSHR